MDNRFRPTLEPLDVRVLPDATPTDPPAPTPGGTSDTGSTLAPVPPDTQDRAAYDAAVAAYNTALANVAGTEVSLVNTKLQQLQAEKQEQADQEALTAELAKPVALQNADTIGRLKNAVQEDIAQGQAMDNVFAVDYAQYIGPTRDAMIAAYDAASAAYDKCIADGVAVPAVAAPPAAIEPSDFTAQAQAVLDSQP